MNAPSPPTSPWQQFYGAVHRLRRRWYRKHARHLPRPVISVGNLHWGGSGKTPLVAAIAAHLRDRGLAVCILSRGYGSAGKGVRVVSEGDASCRAPAPLLGQHTDEVLAEYGYSPAEVATLRERRAI